MTRVNNTAFWLLALHTIKFLTANIVKQKVCLHTKNEIFDVQNDVLFCLINPFCIQDHLVVDVHVIPIALHDILQDLDNVCK